MGVNATIVIVVDRRRGKYGCDVIEEIRNEERNENEKVKVKEIYLQLKVK